MERQRKERLVGAAVLVMLAVIFIPMVLDDSVQPESDMRDTNIPPRPEGEFSSRVVPLEGNTPRAEAPAAPPALPPAAPALVPAGTPGDATQGTGTAPAGAGGSPVPQPAEETPAQTGSEPVSTAAPAAPATAAPPVRESGAAAAPSAWVVQLGSFSDEDNANKLNTRLRKAGFSSFVEPLPQGGSRVFRVRVGPELRRTAAQGVRDRLEKVMGIEGIVVPYP